MSIKRKLNRYVEEMHIPPADHVLPEGVSGEKRADSRGHGRYGLYAGIAGAAVACTAMVSVMVWQPWQQSDSENMAGMESDDLYVADGSNTGAASDRDVLTGEPAGNTDKITDKNMEAAPGGDTAGFGDGVISGSNSISNGAGDDLAYEMDEMEAMAPAADAAGEAAPDEWGVVAEDSEMWGDVWQGSQAGTLTGGEIRDLRNWDNWLRTLTPGYMEQWNMVLDQRAVVYVHHGDTPLDNVHVRLLQEETVLYEAVTDATGNAYLFYQYTVGSEDKPTGIQVQSADGSWTSYDYNQNYANGQLLDVELEQEKEAVKVDLMYVIDTTGSMGDELEYLKAEIQDVIERAADQTGAQIRTSVNFYRDEGDDYVVKYYDFREDAKEVAALVAGQSANGGGDEPEAVHTALDNALHQHSWADDSTVKLLFLVLDAPPHDDEEVKEQLLSLTEEAAAMGVRIIPIAASGAGEDTQQLLRSMAIMTGGTFLFLDDNSGVGYGHTVTVKPEEYSSEYLNEMMIRVIGEYCGVSIDAQEIEVPTEAETTEFVQ